MTFYVRHPITACQLFQCQNFLMRYLILLRKDVMNTVKSTSDTTRFEPVKICSPVKHVFFHKKHKCASTAMRSIFQRYSHRYGLVGMKPSVNHFRWLMKPQGFSSLVKTFLQRIARWDKNKKKALFARINNFFYPKYFLLKVTSVSCSI